jgi:hypothetical protein
MREVQISQFAAAESAAQQHGENRTVRFPLSVFAAGDCQKRRGLLGREPVPKPDTQLLGTFHPPDTGGEFRSEQRSVRGFVGESSYCGKSSIDRSRRELPILEEDG